jgi:hypothetical protein
MTKNAAGKKSATKAIKVMRANFASYPMPKVYRGAIPRIWRRPNVRGPTFIDGTLCTCADRRAEKAMWL